MLRLLTLPLAIGLTLSAAAASEITDKAAQADALATQGKFVDAMDALDQAAAALWDKAPLTFRHALWVQQPAAGFGAYLARANNVFAAGDPMFAYVEPIGFGWRPLGDIFQTDLAADIRIADKDGHQIYEQKDFQKLSLVSHVKNREFMTRFVFTLNGIPSGQYIIETTLRDAITGKSGSFSLPFVIK